MDDIRTRAVTTATLRQHNIGRVAETLLGSEPRSVPTMVRELDLSRPTVDIAVKALTERGMIEARIAPASAGRESGRRPTLYGFRHDRGHALGLDVGAHTVRAVLTDLSGGTGQGREQYAHHCVLDRHDPAERRLAAIDQLTSTLLDRAAITPDAVRAVTAGTPGVVDPDGVVLDCRSMAEWNGERLRDHLRGRFPAADGQVRVDNDANLAAVAEYRTGAAIGSEHLVHLLAGRRIGFGVVINGALLRGVGGRAGELANVRRTPWFAANLWLQRNSPVGGAAAFGPDPAGSHNTAANVDAARRHLAAFVAPVAHGLAELVHTIDPAQIVLGGGLARAGQGLLDAVAEILSRECRPRREPPPLVLSAHAELGVVVGAHLSALDAARDTVRSELIGAT